MKFRFCVSEMKRSNWVTSYLYLNTGHYEALKLMTILLGTSVSGYISGAIKMYCEKIDKEAEDVGNDQSSAQS